MVKRKSFVFKIGINKLFKNNKTENSFVVSIWMCYIQYTVLWMSIESFVALFRYADLVCGRHAVFLLLVGRIRSDSHVLQLQSIPPQYLQVGSFSLYVSNYFVGWQSTLLPLRVKIHGIEHIQCFAIFQGRDNHQPDGHVNQFPCRHNDLFYPG